MKNIKGPVILFVIFALVAAGAYFGKDYIFAKKQQMTSDTNVNVKQIRGGGDGYLGYGFLHTLEFKKQLAQVGLAVDYFDDDGNYDERLKKFANKEYDFITIPINTYIEKGVDYNYPGVVVAVIAESKGADAIVGFPDVLPNNTINDLDNPELKIHYIPGSPNSFLLDLTISDFALEELEANPKWRHEANSAEDVYNLAKKAVKDRTVGDAFVLWDPYATKAIEDLGMVKIWGSDKFNGYILDVFVFHRDYVAKHSSRIDDFLKTYFRILTHYNSNPDDLIKEFSKMSRTKKSTVETMIANIDWYDLDQNCNQMFDIQTNISVPSNDGIINAIYACSEVMIRSGALNKSVDDPYLLINNNFLESLSETSIKAVGTKAAAVATFNILNDKEWSKLNTVGTMAVQDITFQSGTSDLDYNGLQTLDKVATLIANNYKDYRFEIRGHTGKGDEAVNLELSQMRADIVKSRLTAVHGVDPNRLHAKGYGATAPPKMKSGENPRFYAIRWARVEFVLLSNDRL